MPRTPFVRAAAHETVGDRGDMGEGSYVPHAVEDVPEVVLGLGSIGETAIGGSVLLESVDAAGPPWSAKIQ